MDSELRPRRAGRRSWNRLRLRGVEPGGNPPRAGEAVPPVDEIVKIVDTVLVRPDLVPETT